MINDAEKYAPSKEFLSKALSMLGQSPSGHGCIFRKFSLPGQGIVDIKFLENYPNLEYLELPCNSISDISVLSHLPFLYGLDLSSNRISVFDLPPSVHINLRNLDLSRNQLISVTEIGVHIFLEQLCLDRNLIRQIRGLDTCTRLTSLSLAHNAITSLTGLANLPIRYLDLSWNRVHDISETQFLPDLEHLILHHNEIANLEQLSSNCRHLSRLDVSFNLLSKVNELSMLLTFSSLSNLSILGNPFTGIPKVSIRPYVVFHLPQLRILDGLPTLEKEKVNAQTQFAPSPSIVDAFSQAKETVEELRRFAIVQAEPCGFASIVLCGPTGGAKRFLCQRLVRDFPHLFAPPILHTTRPPNADEINGVDYYFISSEAMEQLKSNKKLVSYIAYGKHTTALSVEACQRPTTEGKMGIFRLNLDEAIALYRSGVLNARYIFISPQQEGNSLKHPKQLKRGVRSELCSKVSEIKAAVGLWTDEMNHAVLEKSVFDTQFLECAILNNDFESCYALVKEVALKELLTHSRETYFAQSNTET